MEENESIPARLLRARSWSITCVGLVPRSRLEYLQAPGLTFSVVD